MILMEKDAESTIKTIHTSTLLLPIQMYFILTQSLWVTVCVSKCPKDGDTTLACQPNSVVTSCAAKADSDNTKAVEIYDSSESNCHLI